MDAFIYSPLLPTASQGSVYPGIFHVSDWFPTLLELSGMDSYSAKDDHPLDGFSQVTAMLAADASANPREYLLYNMYYNVNNEAFNISTNAPVAIRDKQVREHFLIIHLHLH